MTEAQALAKLSTLCQHEVYPTLTTAEMQGLLSDAPRFSTHTVSTTYAVGAKVVPSTPNGRLYLCTVAGTTDDTAPVWPTRYTRLSQRIQDGTAVWEDIGPTLAEPYDLSAAARAGWMLKAAKASADIDTGDKDQSTKASQAQTQCLRIANRYGTRAAL